MALRVSSCFKLNKTQAELDFVDVFVNRDIPLFIDPLPFSQRVDNFSQDCHIAIVSYFQRLIECIRSSKDNEAMRLLMHLREPNETRLGFSENQPQGAGIGGFQAKQIFNALKSSTAVKTGFITSLDECELMIEGIGPDKVSDLTTNVLREHLVKYTQEQCVLHNIPLQRVPLPPCFNPSRMQWESDYRDLPVYNRKPILFVPKSIVKLSCAMEHQHYYRHYVLEYMQDEALRGGAYANLVLSLKNGRNVIHKNQLEKEQPCTKEFLYRFSKDHKEVLEKYRGDLYEQEQEDKKSDVDIYEEKEIASALSKAINLIQVGNASASDYHSLMIGIVEFIFFPYLIYPIKEHEIHEGRKRIDISMENAARSGLFHRLHDVRKIPCGKVFFECKNYSTDVANPELDQLGGRFGINRGMFGFLCCRKFDNRDLFIKRCKDTFKDGRGLIIPLDDNIIKIFLNLIEEDKREAIDHRITELIGEVWE